MKLLSKLFVAAALTVGLSACYDPVPAYAGSAQISIIDVMKANPDKVFACSLYAVAYTNGFGYYGTGHEDVSKVRIPDNVKFAADVRLYKSLVAAGIRAAREHHQLNPDNDRGEYADVGRQNIYNGIYNSCKATRGHPSALVILPEIDKQDIELYQKIYDAKPGTSI